MRSISSRKSDRVKELVRLHKKSDRHEAGLFLAEGPAVVHMALEHAPDRVVEVFALDHLVETFTGSDVPVTVCSAEVIEALSCTQNPQGVIALCRMKVDSASEICEREGVVIILDNISDPGNLGTIIRTADATESAGILLYGNCVDPYNDKVVRSSAGSIFRVPIARLESMDSVPVGRTLFALAANASVSLGELDPSVQSPMWIIGSEAHGISPDWESRKVAPTHVKIPMAPGVESLNAAVAASVCLYNFYLHRGSPAPLGESQAL